MSSKFLTVPNSPETPIAIPSVPCVHRDGLRHTRHFHVGEAAHAGRFGRYVAADPCRRRASECHGLKSLEINIVKDGTWTSDIEMQGQFAGMSMKGGGKWSLGNNVITYTSGDNSGTSTARLNGNILVLDPDFSVRRGGKIEVTGEYVRIN